MMKCDHYAVITLSVVDNKITLGCVGRASDARRVYDFSCTQQDENEEKETLMFDDTNQLLFDGTHHHNKKRRSQISRCRMRSRFSAHFSLSLPVSL